jgi:hypothetical protein
MFVATPPWTPEDDEILRRMARSGEDVAAMAKRLNRSEEAVRRRAGRLNVLIARPRSGRPKAKLGR